MNSPARQIIISRALANLELDSLRILSGEGASRASHLSHGPPSGPVTRSGPGCMKERGWKGLHPPPPSHPGLCRPLPLKFWQSSFFPSPGSPCSQFSSFCPALLTLFTSTQKLPPASPVLPPSTPPVSISVCITALVSRARSNLSSIHFYR